MTEAPACHGFDHRRMDDGSVAALAGSIGAALASMVANLSVGKGEFDDRYEVLCGLALRAQAVKDTLMQAVDEDTRAFDAVLKGIRMPKDTEEERVVRAEAIQEGYKSATLVPMTTVEGCFEALGLCREMAGLATPEMISDVGSGALMAHAGLKAAAFNVRINLPSIGVADLPGSQTVTRTPCVPRGIERAAA